MEKKLRNMTKSEIFQICRKMKCPTGTKREMIRYIMLPLKNKNYKMENTCDECAICLNEVNQGKPDKTTCGHCFHPDCLEKWTEINNTCPMCRRTNPTFPFSGRIQQFVRERMIPKKKKKKEEEEGSGSGSSSTSTSTGNWSPSTRHWTPSLGYYT